jgi:MFS family permease
MISGGFFNDKFGPKAVIFTGGLMFGLGLIASGFVHSVGMLILTYGIMSGLGLGMAYGSTISTAVKFFQDKRGLIGGITTGIYGLSSVILPPVITAIVAATDVTMAFKIIGALFYLGIAVVGICFGSFMGVFPGFTVDRFGAKNNSVNYGIMFIGFALAGYFGPSVMRSIFAADGAYQRAFLIALVFDIAGIILTFIYRLVLNKTEGGNH